jgi:hypothetical protein
MTDELTPDTTPEPDPFAAFPDVTPEPDAPEVTYAPTRVNTQAHEQIQAGERAWVGQTVNVDQQ